MADIIHRVGVKAPLPHVYAALSTVEGIAGWWTKDTSGSSQVGGTINVRFHSGGKEIASMHLGIVALEPNERVQWRFTSGPEEWVGADVTFDLSQDGPYTIVRFRHRNWSEANEFMSHCSTKWGTFMLSLKELVETAKGGHRPTTSKSIMGTRAEKVCAAERTGMAWRRCVVNRVRKGERA